VGRLGVPRSPALQLVRRTTPGGSTGTRDHLPAPPAALIRPPAIVRPSAA
jgi:hypothetical protein